MARATEQGLLETEQWEDVPAAPGSEPLGPLAQVEIDADTGQVRRKEGYESFIITDVRPERPA